MNRLDLSVSVRRGEQAGVVVVVVAGEIDVYTADKLRDALVSSAVRSCPNVILDMSAVDFTDSTGLGVMVGAHKRAHQLGGGLKLAGIRDHLRGVLGVTGLSKVFTVYETVEAASADSTPAENQS